MSVSWWERVRLWVTRQGRLVDLVTSLRARLADAVGHAEALREQLDREVNARRLEAAQLRTELAAADRDAQLREAEHLQVLAAERGFGNGMAGRLNALDRAADSMPPDVAAVIRQYTRPHAATGRSVSA